MSFHKRISFIKSALRLIGYGLLVYLAFNAPGFYIGLYNTNWALFGSALFLIAAEVLGIVEELFEK